MKIDLNGAFKKAKKNGVKVFKKDVANKWWPDTKRQDARNANMTNACSGKTDSITFDKLKILSEMLELTASEILGF